MNTCENLQESLRSSVALAAKNDCPHVRFQFDEIRHLVEQLERVYYEGVLAGTMDSSIRETALKYFEEHP